MRTILQQLKALPRLKHLQLDLRGCSQLTDRSILILASELLRIKKLTSLHFLREQVNELSPHVFGCLAHLVALNKPLKRLYLNLKLFPALNQKHEEQLAYQVGFLPWIKELTQLEYLELDLFGQLPANRTLEQMVRRVFDLEPLVDAIANYSKLTHLQLKLNNFAFSVEELANLVTVILLNANWRRLSLAFDLSYFTQVEPLKQMVGTLTKLSQLARVTDIELGWHRVWLGENEVRALLQEIPLLFNCRSLLFSFSTINFNAKSTAQLFALLRQLMPVNSLQVTLGQIKVVENSRLVVYKQENGLGLDLKGLPKSLIAASVHELKQLLNVQIATLERLSIEFNGWEKLKDAQCTELCRSLSQLSQLTTLRLSFKYCAQITILTLHSLQLALDRLTKLKSVTIEMIGCNHLEKRNTKGLEQELRQLLGPQVKLRLHIIASDFY